MRTMLRLTVAFAFGAAAAPALAAGHGNEGTDEVSWASPYTHRIELPAAAELGVGHGNEGGDLDGSRAGSVMRIRDPAADVHGLDDDAPRGEAFARLDGRSADAGG